MSNSKKQILTLVYMALYIALYVVLKYVGNFIPFLDMPNGGSIEIELVAVFIASYHLGFLGGLGVAVLSWAICIPFFEMWFVNPIQIFLDYVGPLAICGLASILWPLKKMGKTGAIVASVLLGVGTFLGVYYCFNQTIWAVVGAIAVALVIFFFGYKFPSTVAYYGVAIAMVIKGFLHVISGAYYWADGVAAGSAEAWIFSIGYNLWYNLVTMAICIIVVPLLAERLKKSGVDFIA